MVTAAVLLVNLFVLRTITRPIGELNEGISRMSRGDLSARVNVHGKNEFAGLASAFNSMSERLEKLDKSRNQFVSNASHELKTPLHVISGYAELMENGLVKEEDIRPFARKIRTESLRLTALVEDIIDLTRLDGGAAEMQRQETDLYRIAENAADSLQAEAEEAGVTLTVRGSSAMIDGIPQVLYSIVYNLCDNAIKYNRPGGSVKVTVGNYPGYAKITVSDTGIGIPESCLDRIFERFYRVDKSHSKEVGGTGLGLSIVKHGVMIHHAQIKVQSTPGKGSDFTITFPKGGTE